jgi:hypothetical protein
VPVYDFLSLFEASETSGWSPDRITSVALRAPQSLGIWIIPSCSSASPTPRLRCLKVGVGSSGEGWSRYGC